MSELITETETVESKQLGIQDEIRSIYHKLANLEFDSEEISEFSLDDLVESYLQKITELEEKLKLLKN